MNKNTEKEIAISEKKEIPTMELVTDNAIIENDYIDDESDDEFDDEFDDESDDEKTATPEPKPQPEEELSSFAIIVKNYLENLVRTDEELQKTLVSNVHSYNMCANYIYAKAKELVKSKSGMQVVQISDNECFVMMKNYYVDGQYNLQLEEEKQKAIDEEQKRIARELAEKERREKAEIKRKEEEDKKRKEEEDKKRWELFLSRPEQARQELSERELDLLILKNSKQGELDLF